MDTMAIKIDRAHCLGGAGRDVAAGEILVAPRDLPVEEAMRKVLIKYAHEIPIGEAIQAVVEAVKTQETTPVVKTQETEVETRDPLIETSATPSRRSRRRSRLEDNE